MDNKKIVLFISSVLFMVSYAAILRKDDAPEEICDRYTPCGWAVYDKLTRDVTSHVKNLCNCSPQTLCYRIEDDISMGTYIYRCRAKDPRQTGDYITG